MPSVHYSNSPAPSLEITLVSYQSGMLASMYVCSRKQKRVFRLFRVHLAFCGASICHDPVCNGASCDVPCHVLPCALQSSTNYSRFGRQLELPTRQHLSKNLGLQTGRLSFVLSSCAECPVQKNMNDVCLLDPVCACIGHALTVLQGLIHCAPCMCCVH